MKTLVLGGYGNFGARICRTADRVGISGASTLPASSSEDLTPGAQACMGLLSLDEFQPEFERWGMVTDVPAEEVLDGASAV